MPVARPIMLTMLMANTETSKVWPTSAVSADRHGDGDQAEDDRQPGGDHGAEDDQQDDEGDRHADALALAAGRSRRSG